MPLLKNLWKVGLTHWKGADMVLCVFILWAVVFHNALRIDEPVFLASVAATVLTVFLYRKIARKVGL